MGRRESRQGRGARTQDKLLDAAEAMILSDGVEGASISKIAARAGVSVGALYHHFTDKQALLRALFERAINAYSAASRKAAAPARWSGAGVGALVAGYVDFMVAMGARKDAGPSIIALILADQPQWRGRLTTMQAEGRRHVAGLILQRRDQLNHPDPVAATAFFIDQLAALVAARANPAQRDAAISNLSDDAFRAEAVVLAERYLGLTA
jgi:AcrR family transcriptional regulator